jgi:hypothetical protein
MGPTDPDARLEEAAEGEKTGSVRRTNLEARHRELLFALRRFRLGGHSRREDRSAEKERGARG